jgi:hypothetical protein
MTWSMSACGTPRSRIEVRHAARHIGVDDAGMHRIAADVVAQLRRFDRAGLGIQAHAALAHAVQRAVGRADQPGDRRQVDDRGAGRAPGALLHGQERVLGAQHHALQIDIEERRDLVDRGVLDAAMAIQAGIVHQDVQASVLAQGLGHDRLPVGLERDIVLAVHRGAAAGIDLGDQRLAVVLAQIGGDDRRAGLRQQARGGRPDAPGCPGDDCYLAIDSIQVVSLANELTGPRVTIARRKRPPACKRRSFD